MFEGIKRQFAKLKPEHRTSKNHEEVKKWEAQDRGSETQGKTLDMKFVRRSIDNKGMLVEEYDYSGIHGHEPNWQRVDQAVEKFDPRNSRSLQRVGSQELATQGSKDVVLHGQVIEVPNQIPGASPQHVIDGHSQRMIEGGVKSGAASPEVPNPIMPPIEKRTKRVVIADITPIVDRYAKSLAEQKIHEDLEKSGKNFLKKAWYRLAENGYTDERVGKYFVEAKKEILNNRNLLSSINTKLMRKSEGKTLASDADDIHNEILNEIIEAFDKELLDQNTRDKEVKAEHVDLGAAQNARIDAVGAELITAYVLGNITDQKDFDSKVEERIVPLLEGAGAKQGEDRMYASSLFSMAEGYKKEVQETLKAYGKEFGPDQKKYIETFIKGSLHLDVKLGEKQADLYQKRPESSMQWYEKYVDHVQKGSILAEKWLGKLVGEETAGKVSRTAGRVLANPVLYAAVGNIAGRAAARGAGTMLGTAAGASLAVGTGIAFMPATLAIIGTGIGTGLYLKARASRERKRDIARREQEVVMGLREQEQGYKVMKAEDAIKQLLELQNKTELLNEEDKKLIGEIQARLDLQAKNQIDLIGVSKEESEKYKTKFLAEQRVRKAMRDLAHKVIDQYGSDPKAQQIAFRKYQGDAERLLAAEIEKVNQEKAEEIKRYSNKVGLYGGLAAMGAAALSPAVMKGLKVGANYAFNSHFDTSNITYLEEAWHKARSSAGFGHPEGSYAGVLLDRALPGMHAKINLPPGFNAVDQGVDSHGNHVFGIVDVHGNAIPGAEKIPLDAAGNIADPHALDSLKSAGWNINEVHGTSGVRGSGAFTEAELRADGFSQNPRADWHHIHDPLSEIKKHIFNGKELQAYKRVIGGGSEDWNVQKMLNNLSDNAEYEYTLSQNGMFGLDTEGRVDTQLQALKEQLVAWHATGGKAEIAKHLVLRVIASEHDNKVTGLNKIVGHFDDHGHLTLDAKYAHAAYKEIGIVDDQGKFHVLATEKTGSEMLHETTSVGDKLGEIEFRPPQEHLVEVYGPAGYRRSTDSGIDKERDQERKRGEIRGLEAEIKQLRHEIKHKERIAALQTRIDELHNDLIDHGPKALGEHGEGTEHGPEEGENLKHAVEAALDKVKKKEFSETYFNEIVEHNHLDKKTFAMELLKSLEIDFESHKAAAAQLFKELKLKEPTDIEVALVMIALIQSGIDLKQKAYEVSLGGSKESEAGKESSVEAKNKEELTRKATERVMEKAKQKAAEKKEGTQEHSKAETLEAFKKKHKDIDLSFVKEVPAQKRKEYISAIDKVIAQLGQDLYKPQKGKLKIEVLPGGAKFDKNEKKGVVVLFDNMKPATITERLKKKLKNQNPAQKAA